MTTDTHLPTDADFEAELRAMLQRRAADVHPSRATARARIADAEPAAGHRAEHDAQTTGRARIVVRLDRQNHAERRIARIAAALVLVAGAVGLAAVAATGRTTDNGSNTTTGGLPTAIWPLSDTTPPELLATPESTTRAYLSEVAGLRPDFPLGRSVVDGTEATVDYTLEGTPSSVSLRQRDGRWYVTGATNDLAVIDWVTAPEGRFVDVEVVSGLGALAPGRLRARLIGADGRVIDTADVAFEYGERVENPGPPLRDGLWHTQLFVTTGALPISVRVDVLSANVDTEAVVAHASVAVPGAPDALDPATVAPTATTAPPITVDPDPQPMPPGPDRLPALWADEGSSSVDSGSSGLDGWPDAATALLNTVVDDESPKGAPLLRRCVARRRRTDCPGALLDAGWRRRHLRAGEAGRRQVGDDLSPKRRSRRHRRRAHGRTCPDHARLGQGRRPRSRWTPRWPRTRRAVGQRRTRGRLQRRVW